MDYTGQSQASSYVICLRHARSPLRNRNRTCCSTIAVTVTNGLLVLALTAIVAMQPDAQSALREGARLEQAGKAAAALESYQWALEASPRGSRDRATALLAMAGLESDLGRYADATRHARDAANIFRALRDPSGLANALNRSGLASLYEGRYDDAEREFTSALETARTSNDIEGQAEHLTNLANVQFFLGRYASAADEYGTALKLATTHASAPWSARRRRLVLVNQAILYQRLGREQDALAIYRDLGSAAGDLKPSEQAQVLVNQGVLYRRLGDPIKALETYDHARELFARDRHTDGELGVLKNRGIVLALDLNQLAQAEQTFTDALAIANRTGNQREMLHARLYRAETRLRAGNRSGAREDFQAGLDLARALETPEEEWKALYGLGRVQSGPASLPFLHDAVSVVERIRERIRVPSLRSEFLNDKREVYDALISARLHQADPQELFGLLERSHSRAWRERLALGTAELRAVQRTIPPRVLVLDYWNSPAGSAVIAISREQAGVVPLQIHDGDIRGLIEAVSGPGSRWRDIAAAVARQVLPPERWFNEISHVIVVPDGAVALVPFDVLPVGGHLLVERAATSYVPTAALLLRPSPPVSRWPGPPWRLQLSAFGDPIFGSAALDEPAHVRTRLTASAAEVRRVATELGGRSMLHLGADDRKDHLLTSAASRAPILHLATHAMADTDAMEQSRLLFSSVSGAAGPADYLFLKEAYEMPLTGVELAVLSACETERGRMVRGEGVQSFSRAFLAAGARSAVTTMWRVADAPTAEFMAVFYHHLQRGLPRDEALRQAKLRFIETHATEADPHFWASFVLTGDGLRPIPRAHSWRGVLLWPAMAIALAIAITAARGLRRTTR